MHGNARGWGATFRGHLKTQGRRASFRSPALVVSTLMEAWGVVQGDLVADGTVKDMLYGLPVGLNNLSALHAETTRYGGTVRILLDHLDQVFGLYTYVGYSYGVTSLEEAISYLTGEVPAMAMEPFVLSVGSTPTALGATAEAKLKMASTLNGTLVSSTNLPKVLATVISYCPGKGYDGQDEAICDAEVFGKSWKLERTSQEHGILVQVPPDPESGRTNLSTVEIVGWLCLIAAAYPWYRIYRRFG
ncbi:hypothetical protein F4604DRAFT_1896295 [Suillus subluteus]|nr:hypothetical protein F4604DRAFT_1896295 [Suillus subluteus]